MKFFIKIETIKFKINHVFFFFLYKVKKNKIFYRKIAF